MEPMISQIGGEAAVRALVTRFYDLIETLPEAEPLLTLHQRGHGLAHARPAQIDFLTGFFGGARSYAARHGSMSLREIHAHLAITPDHARIWLEVMARAMAETGIAPPQSQQIMTTFRRAAQMLVNMA